MQCSPAMDFSFESKIEVKSRSLADDDDAAIGESSQIVKEGNDPFCRSLPAHRNTTARG